MVDEFAIGARLSAHRNRAMCCVDCDCQRGENGGLDPLWLIFAFLGRPDLQSRGPKILILKGFGASGLGQKVPFRGSFCSSHVSVGCEAIGPDRP